MFKNRFFMYFDAFPNVLFRVLANIREGSLVMRKKR